MPGPPIRKPSDHSPPAGSPRNIAGHHVLHRPLMPRHPPNAQKNKQQNTRQNQETCRRNLTVRCSRPLYSSQPTHPHPPKTPRNGTLDGPGNPGRTAPEPRQHATPTRTKHAKGGHPPPPNTGSRECVSYTNTDKPATPARTNPRDTTSRPSAEAAPPAGPDPFNSLSKIKRPGSHPHT